VLGAEVPIVLCDARVRDSAKATLVELLQHAIARASASLRDSGQAPSTLPAPTSG
jgi:hypothetical protein